MTDHAATELLLFIKNDADLHRQQHVPIWKNLATKKARSQYKHDLAVKAFGYLVDAGAKKYVKTFGEPPAWHQQFPVPTRKAVAEDLTQEFEGEFELGNYDYLLPKKYQKEMLGVGGKTKFPSKGHSTKKKSPRKTRLDLHTQLHEPGALRTATDRQLRGFFRDEKRDVTKARAEASRRGLTLHAHKKSASQLDREIADLVPSWRGGQR